MSLQSNFMSRLVLLFRDFQSQRISFRIVSYSQLDRIELFEYVSVVSLVSGGLCHIHYQVVAR